MREAYGSLFDRRLLQKSVGIGKTLLIVKSVLAGLGLDLSARQPQYEFSRRIVGRPGEVKKKEVLVCFMNAYPWSAKNQLCVRFCEGLL